MRGNAGGLHTSNLDGKDDYKVRPKCRPKCMQKSEGRKVPIKAKDNITLAEGSLPALVKVLKQGRIS